MRDGEAPMEAALNGSREIASPSCHDVIVAGVMPGLFMAGILDAVA